MPRRPKHDDLPGRKVFISFAGPRAGAVAKALKDLIQQVLPDQPKPFLSSRSIGAGGRPAGAIRRALEESVVGIACFTNDNLLSRWMHYEIGAIDMAGSERMIIPLLIDDVRAQLRDGPFELFPRQYVGPRLTEAGFRKVLQAISQKVDPAARWSAQHSARLTRSWAAFNAVVTAQSAQEHRYAAGLLPRLASGIKAADASDAPLQNYVARELLADANATIEELAHFRPADVGAPAYLKQVLPWLEPRGMDRFVLALCGRKDFTPSVSRNYFGAFMRFATCFHRAGDPHPRVCRIFVEPADGFSADTRAAIAMHQRHRLDGALDLVIPGFRRGELGHDYPGLAEALDDGFGFLLFCAPTGRDALVHAGVDQKMRYNLLRHRPSQDKLIDIFRHLAGFAKGFRTTERRVRALCDRARQTGALATPPTR